VSISDGYALRTPGGKMVAETFAVDKGDAEVLAYDYLSKTRAWAAKGEYWKQWDLFVAERERRGWVVQRIHLLDYF